MATWVNCGNCGGTGENYIGEGTFQGRCYCCGGKGIVKATVKAKRDYECECCHLPITKGTEYICNRLAPWEQEDGEKFVTYRAHADCDAIRLEMYPMFDGRLPYDNSEWQEVLEYWQLKHPAPVLSLTLGCGCSHDPHTNFRTKGKPNQSDFTLKCPTCGEWSAYPPKRRG